MSSTRRRRVRKTAVQSAARDELITIQQHWVQNLKDRIYETETRHNPQLDKYYREYRADFQKGYESLLSREQIVNRIAKADIAYFGDYHSLKLAQTTYVSLVEEVASDFDRPIVLALEMVESRHQRFIDAFLSDKLSEQEFLSSIDYDESWGFDWQNYRRVFDLARRFRLKVVGVNLNSDGKKDSLSKRDAHSAKLIASLRVFYPDALIAVLFGDLHVAECHLPKLVARELVDLSARAKEIILYQNSETLYWELVEAGLENNVDAVKIRKDAYCLMNATPLMKFQSWVSWQDRDIDMVAVGSDHSTWDDLKSQLSEVIETIDEFFSLNAEGRDKFSLYATHNLDFLSDLAASAHYDEAQIERIREMIGAGRSVIIPQTRTLYLASLALNESAWLAASFLRLCAVGTKDFTRSFEPRDAFYVSVFDEALGTVGTMLMNSRYRVMTPFDHEQVIFGLKGKRRLSEVERESRDLARAFLAHHDMIESHVSGYGRTNLRAIYRLQAGPYMALTRAIGRYLGACLFQGLHRGTIEKAMLVDLFKRKWTKGEAFQTYLETREAIGELPDILRPISESL